VTGARAATRAFALGLALAAAAGAAAPPPEFAAALDDAVAQARGGDREKAAALLTSLAQDYPDQPAVYYNLGLTYEFDADGNRYKGDGLNAAASFYQKALACDPDFAPAHFNLGVLWQKLGNGEAAAAEYRLLVKRGGDLGDRAAYNLALVLREQGRRADSVAVLDRKESYDDAARVRLLALLAEEQGEVGRAITLWKRALELADSPTMSALAVKHLQTLRGY